MLADSAFEGVAGLVLSQARAHAGGSAIEEDGVTAGLREAMFRDLVRTSSKRPRATRPQSKGGSRRKRTTHKQQRSAQEETHE